MLFYTFDRNQLKQPIILLSINLDTLERSQMFQTGIRIYLHLSQLSEGLKRTLVFSIFCELTDGNDAYFCKRLNVP